MTLVKITEHALLRFRERFGDHHSKADVYRYVRLSRPAPRWVLDRIDREECRNPVNATVYDDAVFVVAVYRGVVKVVTVLELTFMARMIRFEKSRARGKKPPRPRMKQLNSKAHLPSEREARRASNLRQFRERLRERVLELGRWEDDGGRVD